MHMKETPQNDSGNRSGEEPHIDVKMQAYYDRLKTGKIDQADLISDSCQILKKASLSSSLSSSSSSYSKSPSPVGFIKLPSVAPITSLFNGRLDAYYDRLKTGKIDIRDQFSNVEDYMKGNEVVYEELTLEEIEMHKVSNINH